MSKTSLSEKFKRKAWEYLIYPTKIHADNNCIYFNELGIICTSKWCGRGPYLPYECTNLKSIYAISIGYLIYWFDQVARFVP